MSTTTSALRPRASRHSAVPELPGVRATSALRAGEVSPRAAFQDVISCRGVVVDATTTSDAVTPAEVHRLRPAVTVASVHVYVLGRDSQHAQRVARRLEADGALRVSVVRGGLPAWVQQGMPELRPGVDGARDLG